MRIGKKMNFETLLIERRKGVTRLLLNRPTVLNAINSVCVRELQYALKALQQDRGTRLLLISGSSDRAFSVGADVQEIADLVKTRNKEGIKRFSRMLEGLFRQVESTKKLTVAAVNGPAIGAGAELALACDVRLLSTKSYISFPEARLGLVPPTNRLKRLCGDSVAAQFALTGQKIMPRRAKQMGLALEVFPRNEFDKRSMDLAFKFSSVNVDSISISKKKIEKPQRKDFAYHSDDRFFTKEFRAALDSFLNKKSDRDDS